MCRCGSIENSQHFFFHCPYYQQHRNALLNVVSTYHRPTLDLLLYGESSLSYDINMIICENIHRFILKCKRFSWDVLNTAMVMRLLYYSYPLQKVLYSMLDAGCPDPLTPNFPPTPFLSSQPTLSLHPSAPSFCPFTFSLPFLTQKCFIWNAYSYDMKAVTKEWSIAETNSRRSWESNPVLPVKNQML